jgi:hypothetical protein
VSEHDQKRRDELKTVREEHAQVVTNLEKSTAARSGKHDGAAGQGSKGLPDQKLQKMQKIR